MSGPDSSRSRSQSPRAPDRCRDGVNSPWAGAVLPTWLATSGCRRFLSFGLWRMAAGPVGCRRAHKRQRVAAQTSGTEARTRDLADVASVRTFAERWTGPIDVLIDNAGITAVPEGRTADGFELQIGTNHLGPFLLTNLLLPSIGSSPSVPGCTRAPSSTCRISTGSTAIRQDARLANLLFSFELQRQLSAAGSHVRAVAAHPGVARTNLAKTAGGSSQRRSTSPKRLSTQSSRRSSRPGRHVRVVVEAVGICTPMRCSSTVTCRA
jgi:NAD(P)-dependent dehydrogenase (short-subunit alcohol dehydrogenase family)